MLFGRATQGSRLNAPEHDSLSPLPGLVPTAGLERSTSGSLAPVQSKGPGKSGTYTAPRTWSGASQLSPSVSPGQHTHRCSRESIGIVRTGQRSPQSWVHVALGALPDPAGYTSIQKPTGTCKQSGKGFDSRKFQGAGGLHEAFDGS